MNRTPADSSESGVTVEIAVVRLPHGRGLPLPAYQSAGAAGMDLLAAVPKRAPLSLAAGARALVPTGLVLQLPPGFEAQVRPRSGLALRHGITVLNTPGTIDSDIYDWRFIWVNLRFTAGERMPPHNRCVLCSASVFELFRVVMVVPKA